MLNNTESDLKALRAELAQLRTDLTGITETLQSLARHGVDDFKRKARNSTENLQDEISRHAETITKQIEEKPVAASAVSFVVGLLLGLLVSRK